MDAITLSTSRLVSTASLDTSTAWRMIIVAGMANMLFKAGLVLVLGARSFIKPVLLGMAISLLGGLALLALWPT
jgi:uncharacterized membrane protein (DUF4010 family)